MIETIYIYIYTSIYKYYSYIYSLLRYQKFVLGIILFFVPIIQYICFF